MRPSLPISLAVALIAAAPAAPGAKATFLPADKHGFGTSRSRGSDVWFTLRASAMSEVYYPDLGTPSVRSLVFAVTDGRTFTERDDRQRGSVQRRDGLTPAGTRGAFEGRRVVTSRLQRLRPTQATFRRLLPLMPLGVRDLRPDGARLLLSSSSAFAHGIRVPDGVPHVCYCHSPFRYAWHERRTALREAPAPLRPVLGATLHGIRRWDLAAAARVTQYVANSRITQERIGEFYGREAPIVHPPVAVERFAVRAEPAEDWFLTVSEVTRHKRIEVALAAARRAGRRIRVVGTGPDLERLRREYAGSAEFLGRVGDEELTNLYARARAMVLPNVEEFGIAAVEPQAAGRPVLAVDAGGARETVVEGETGHRVPVDDVEALAAAMADGDFDRMDPGHIRANAERFSRERFRERLRAEVERAAR